MQLTLQNMLLILKDTLKIQARLNKNTGIFYSADVISLEKRLKFLIKLYDTLRKSVQMRSFFQSVFSRIRTEHGDLRSKSEYGKIQTRKNSLFGQFSHTDIYCEKHEFQYTTQITFTCSNSTTEALLKVVKQIQSQQQKHQNDVNDVTWEYP